MILFQQNPKYNYLELKSTKMRFEYKTLPLMIPSSGLISLALIFPVRVYLFTITLNLSRVSADLGDLFSRLLQNFAEINPRKVT